MKYRLAIFDFDGTLADSFPFFLQVFNSVADRHGFKRIELESLPNLRNYTARRMMELLEIPAWMLPFVAKSFIALMRDNAGSIKLFEQVDEMLTHLASKGVVLSVVSSNAFDNIQRILGPDNIRLISHFECGMSIFGKSARLRKVLGKAGIPPHEAIYIGDQVTDLESAHAVNVAFGAVSWGYGTIESLRKHAPDVEFARVSDIREIA